MADFDPYHKWLGIAPKDQPPHHYRLLGIDLFESDPDVIDAAANKQMAFLQSCASGPKLVFSQRLLNEIAAARLRLLNAKEKAAYDAKLRTQSAEQEHRKLVSVSNAVSTETVEEPEAEGNLPDFNVEEPFCIENLIRQAPKRSSSQIKPGGSFFPMLLVTTLLVCGAVGLFYRFGKSNEKSALGGKTGQSGIASRKNQKVPKKTAEESRPKSEKANSNLASTRKATDKKDAQAKSLNSSPSSSLEEGAYRESALTAGQAPNVSSGSPETVRSPQSGSLEVEKPKSIPTPQPPTKIATGTKKTEVKKEPKRPTFVLNDAFHWAGNWYWFSESQATFQEALVQAKRAKGRLVIIGSKDENRFIADRIRGSTFLGMLKEKGIWNNALGNRQSFFNWDNGQPSNGQEEVFAAIHKDGRWHDYLSDKLYFCIEWGTE